MKKKRPNRDAPPRLSTEADAAILRLARLLGRQIARELDQERQQREKRTDVPPKSCEWGLRVQPFQYQMNHCRPNVAANMLLFLTGVGVFFAPYGGAIAILSTEWFYLKITVFTKDELVPAFAFYLVSDDGEPSMRLVDVPDVDAAKRWAMDAIRYGSLHTILFWDGVRVIEVKRPAMRQPRKKPRDAEERGKRMIAMKAKGMKQRGIAAAFGISIGRVRDVMAREELRAREEAIQTTRAALSGRANNVLRHLVIEPEADPAERDRLLPERVATLTRGKIMNVGNSGKVTLAEIEAWLWERGLCLSADI